MLDQVNIKHKKTVRERFKHLNTDDFLKNCKGRVSNAKKLITRDKNILEGKGTLKGLPIKVTNPKVFENRIKSNEKILDIWQDAIKEEEFDVKVENGIREALESKLENTYIEETLFTSKYILDISGGDKPSWQYVNDKGEEEESVEYFIKVYETEEDLENGEEYSGGGLSIIESELNENFDECIKAKMQYIKSFIYIGN